MLASAFCASHAPSKRPLQFKVLCRPRGRWALRILVGLTVACIFSASSRADDDDDDDVVPPPRPAVPAKMESDDGPSSSSSSSNSSAPNKGQAGDGPGVNVSGGFNFGQGVVQDRSIAPIEAFPFYLMNDGLIFGDLRFFPTIEGTFGGSVGAGYRYYSKGLDRIFGISGWFDADGTRAEYFQQLGLSLETFGGPFDFRTNFYLPVGQTYQQSSNGAVPGSARFVNQNIAFDQLTTFLAANRGLDMEVGVPIPGQFAHDHGIRIYGGWYFFNDNQGDNIIGGSARVAANIFSGLDMSAQVTNDSYFDTRGFVNVSWTFGPLHRSQLSQDDSRGRMGEHVTRNYTVLVTSRSNVDPAVMAIDPATSQPYVVAHVNSAAAPGGNGSVNSPFQTIAAAQAVNNDLVFVQAGSIFHGANATIVMKNGEQLFGDGTGVQNFITAAGVGPLLLPHGPTAGSVPVLDSATGASVTLANNVFLSNFSISNSSGPGIAGNNVGGVVVQNVQVNHSGSDGIQIVNPLVSFLPGSTVSVLFDNVSINNSAGNGLSINGGSASIQYNGLIAGSQGHDLLVENTAAGTAAAPSLVDMTGAQFPGSGSQGILLQNVAGNVDFKNLNVMNTTASGVEILGGTGAFTFFGPTTVVGAGGPSILIQNLAAGGSVVFENNLTINNRHDEGLEINNSSAPVTVVGTTTITNEGSTGATALDIKNSSGTVTFDAPVNITNTTLNPGVSLQNNTGTTIFKTLNVTSDDGTALFAKSAGNLAINAAQTADTNGNDLGGAIKATNATAIDIENTNLNVNLSSVYSSGSSIPVGLKLVNDSGSFAVFGAAGGALGTGGTIQGATTGIFLQNIAAVGLASMNVTGNGVGIVSQNVGSLAISNFQVTNSATFGVDALDTKILTVAGSAFAGNGSNNIRVQMDEVASYAYTFASNSLNSASADNILVHSLNGSRGSTINLTAEGNAFTNTQTGTAGINANVNGTLTATITGNTFVVSGGSNQGVLINNSATTNVTTVNFANNTFTSEGGSDTGLHVLAAGPSTLNISSNNFLFGATSGTGMEFSLAGSSTVNISTNSIQDSTDGLTGILFDSITGPGSVALSNNFISLSHNGTLLDRGIIFSNVVDTTAGSTILGVSLSGTNANVIQGLQSGDTAFFVPSGTTSGQITVNGTPMP